MLKSLLNILVNEQGGLGLTQASILSSVADGTGDDSSDAAVKIKRLINESGPDFCAIADWPFLRTDISFAISTGAYKFSGASYIPQTFKKFLAKPFILYSSRRYPLTEVSLGESYAWLDPSQNIGLPYEFCLTRNESDYWEIQVNRQPDQAYTVYGDIEQQWVDLTASNETLITKEYFTGFCHFVKLRRAVQQGDSELYVVLKKEWHDPASPKDGILTRMCRTLSKPAKKKGVIVDEDYLNPFRKRTGDYSEGSRLFAR